MAINDGRVQYSGTERPTALKASVDEPKRLAGKLSFDATSSGGPRVEAEVDAALLKELKAPVRKWRHPLGRSDGVGPARVAQACGCRDLDSRRRPARPGGSGRRHAHRIPRRRGRLATLSITF
jgi:hypothetical protein